MKLILAQGNPGTDFAQTRHNVGFMVIDAFSKQLQAEWTPKAKFHADLADVTLAGEKVLLVKPTTFYNETGRAARALADFYKLESARDILVIHDDLALSLGTIRVREKGSDAGNNGIKSLNAHLGENYTRLRIGTWSELRDKMSDIDFVLAKFSAEETKRLRDDIIPHTLTLIEAFCNGTLETTSHTL